MSKSGRIKQVVSQWRLTNMEKIAIPRGLINLVLKGRWFLMNWSGLSKDFTVYLYDLIVTHGLLTSGSQNF